MNCDECKERVFDLIEREAVDPEGVREVLARCPECRALFEEMQAALRSAAELPREEPPEEIDAAILRAARRRPTKMEPRRRWWFRSPQWAVAAAALLAVGVGVWSIPRGDEAAMDEASPVRGQSASKVEAAGLADEEAVVTDTPAEIAADSEFQRPEPAPRLGVAKSGSASPAASPPPGRAPGAKRKTAQDADVQAQRRSVAEASDVAEARQAFAGASSDVEVVEEDVGAIESDGEQKTMSAECKRRISELDARSKEHGVGAEALLPSEDALALAHCYREAGDIAKARVWFEEAALDPKTKRRALRALRALPPK